MRFKVGDKVRVRKDLEVDKEYGNLYFIDSMEEYKSKEFTISRVWDDCYRLKGINWYWTDEMLEPIEREKNNMNIEELNLEYKNKMDALMEEYKDKIKEVAEVEKEQFIKKGQEYFIINPMFYLEHYDYDGDDNAYDKRYLKCGNMFPYTKENREEVEKEVKLIAERRKLQSEMEQFARQNNEGEIDWNNDDQLKWHLRIERNETITIGYGYYFRQPNDVFFTSEVVAQKALERFGDKIRELYLKEGEE